MSLIDELEDSAESRRDTSAPKIKGRVPSHPEIIEACRASSIKAISILDEVIRLWLAGNKTISPKDAIKAAETILNRGFGTAPQVVRLEATDGDDTLALDPSTLDAYALTQLASVLRNAHAIRTLERVKATSTEREEVTVAIGGSEGFALEGDSGPESG